RTQERQRLRRGEAPDLGGARAGRERRVEEVDVEGEEHRTDADRLPDEVAVALRPERAQLVGREDGEAELARGVEVGGAVQRAAHPRLHRRLRVEQPFLDRALEGRAMEVALP